jgi:gamma-glutamylcyclotransferase (GGCT)/AIG2-like uncharacterized protein YtfP
MPLMFLNGGAMRGGPLHHLLRDARLVAVVRTAPKYRFYSVGDRFPALEPTADGGVAVIGELYDVPWDVLRDSLLPAEPAELELGVIELEDGTGTLSMVRRRDYREPAGAYRDISKHADWNGYLAAASITAGQ